MKTEGIGIGSQIVEFSSSNPERSAAVVQPIAAIDLPTAKLSPVRMRVEIPNPFLVNHNVMRAELKLPPYHHRV